MLVEDSLKQHIHITAQHNLFNLKLAEVWQYRELIILLAKRGFRVGYRQTILGPLWLFINPMLSSIMYVILFGNIAKLSTNGVPQILFYLTGHAFWDFFSGRVNSNSETFTNNASLFGKVYFPRLVIPISNILSGMARFSIQMMLAFVLYLFFFFKGQVRPNLLLLFTLPIIIAEIGLMGMGVGIIISSLTTKYRDLLILVRFGLQLWMYATPIVYPLNTVKGKLKILSYLNPVTAPAELFRCALFNTDCISMRLLLYSLLFTIIVTLTGIVVFNKVERNFMDTV